MTVLKGHDAFNYDFALETFKGLTELNNYEFVKADKRSDISENYLDFKNDYKKLYYYGNNNFGIEVIGIINHYLMVEAINIAIKYLEILGFDPVRIKLSSGENTAEIQELLEDLEIEFETDDTLNNKSYEIITSDSKGDDVCVICGNYTINNISFEVNFEILNKLLIEHEIKFRKAPLDVYVIPESKDVFNDTIVIGTSLKDVGFKTEVDYSQNDLKEKVIGAKNSNTSYIIIVNAKDLKQYSIRLIDAKTEEEKIVPINDLQDELYMNF